MPAPPAGEAWLSIDVPLTAIQQQIAEHVPTTLAAEKDRPIGAAGLVTYRVTRQAPKIRASAGRVSVTLPVEIDLSLCKPFGSVCIGYGSCTPAYDIKATWDLTLGPDYELKPLQLSQKVTRGCRVGVDVTDQVTRVVSEQLDDIEARIQREKPRLAPWVDRAATELTRPTMLTVGHCVALSPSEILLDGPTTSGDRVTFAIGVRGVVSEVECSAPPQRGRGLPVTRQSERSLAPTLELRQHVTKDAFGEALREGLSLASKPELGFALQEFDVTLDGVLFSVQLSGAECGVVWVLAGLDVTSDGLRLTRPRVLAQGTDSERRSQLEAALAVPLELRLGAPALLADLAFEERTAILGTLVEERTDLDLQVTGPKIARATAHMATDGVWIVSEVESRLHLEARARRPD